MTLLQKGQLEGQIGQVAEIGPDLKQRGAPISCRSPVGGQQAQLAHVHPASYGTSLLRYSITSIDQSLAEQENAAQHDTAAEKAKQHGRAEHSLKVSWRHSKAPTLAHETLCP